MEDGVLAEFLIERKEEMGIAGNIYKGKVSRVLPGMQAAFVDIGMEKAGFLHASDFYEIPGDVQIIAANGEDAEFTEPPKPPPPSRRLPLEESVFRAVKTFSFKSPKIPWVPKVPVSLRTCRCRAVTWSLFQAASISASRGASKARRNASGSRKSPDRSAPKRAVSYCARPAKDSASGRFNGICVFSSYYGKGFRRKLRRHPRRH